MPQNTPYTQEYNPAYVTYVTIPSGGDQQQAGVAAQQQQAYYRPGQYRVYTNYRVFYGSVGDSTTAPETLEQVIHRLHRRQKFYLEHKEELPSW